MYLAHKLKHSNMPSYLLYMWQVEDIIRAFELDLDKLIASFIRPMHLNAEEEKQEVEWYESLIDMMRREGVTKKGHISLINNILQQLEEKHGELIDSPKGAIYRAKYMQLLPSVVLLRAKSDNPTQTDLEMCFVFMYCMMNLKREGKEISQETQIVQQEVAKLLAMLAEAFKEE